jgi:hypothetical protein
MWGFLPIVHPSAQNSSTEPILMVDDKKLLGNSDYCVYVNPSKPPSNLPQNELFHVLVGIRKIYVKLCLTHFVIQLAS